MAAVFVRVAQYLAVDRDELIARHQAGQEQWVNWACASMVAEYEAQEILNERAAHRPHDGPDD